MTVEGKEEPLLELLGMPRPFTKLKSTDLDAWVAGIEL